MIKHYGFVFFFLLLGFSVRCAPEPPQERQGIFWKISKGDQRGFILGSIHRYPKRAFRLSEKMLDSLKTCTVLAIERNIWDASDQAYFIQQLRHQSIQRIYPIVNAKYGASLQDLEGQLFAYADKQGISITGLERSAEVLDLLAQTPEFAAEKSDQVLFEEYKRALKNYQAEAIDEYVEKYATEDLGLVGKSLLIDQRNRNWLDDMERLLQDEKVFFTVGMGHLGGAQGLLALLTAKGYQLERIRL